MGKQKGKFKIIKDAPIEWCETTQNEASKCTCKDCHKARKNK